MGLESLSNKITDKDADHDTGKSKRHNNQPPPFPLPTRSSLRTTDGVWKPHRDGGGYGSAGDGDDDSPWAAGPWDEWWERCSRNDWRAVAAPWCCGGKCRGRNALTSAAAVAFGVILLGLVPCWELNLEVSDL